MVGWIAGNATPSFIEGQSLSAEVNPNSTYKKNCHIGEVLRTDRIVCVFSLGLVCMAGAEYGGHV